MQAWHWPNLRGACRAMRVSAQMACRARRASHAIRARWDAALADHLAAMRAALPQGSQEQGGITDRERRCAEPQRLCAFEVGEDSWWLVRGEDAGAMAGGAAG